MTQPTLTAERADAIRDALPGTWDAQEDDWRGWSLKRGDGLTLHIQHGWDGTADRILIGSRLPPANGASLYGCRRAEITCTERKTDAQVARDIERRLLPTAEHNHVKALKRIAEHEDYEARLIATKVAVIAALGSGETGREITNRRQFGWITGIETEVATPDRVKIAVDAESSAEAVCLIRALKAARETWRKVNGGQA